MALLRRGLEMIDKLTTLETLIADAKKRPAMTEEEWAAQRASFVRGEIGMGSDRDEANYRKAMTDGDRAEMERLNQEAQERVRRAFR